MPSVNDPPVSGLENPADRALTLALADEAEASLRWAAALVKSQPAGPLGLLITGRLLGALDAKAAATRALEVGVARAIDAGNLPLAVAGCCELKKLGHDARDSLEAIATAFARDSERLLAQGATPPELPGRGDDFQPLPPALAGRALIARAEQVIDEARELWRVDQNQRTGPPKIVHQTLFSTLDAEGLRAMVGIFDVMTVPTGAHVIEEGMVGSEAYVVARGELEVQRGTQSGQAVRLARLGSGALFGEMALLSRAPRAASVVACRPSILLVASKDALEAVVEHQPQVGREFAAHCRRRMVENLVRTSSVLNAVKSKDRAALVDCFETRTFEVGDKLIQQDQESDGLHLIASGEVAVVHREGDDSTVITTLGPGDVVGEVALVLRRPATADVIAEHPTVTLHLPRDGFLDIVKRHPVLLAQLYELAVKRDEETSSIVAQEATDIDEFVLI
jgi:CRP-like cAMP-binding protein